MLHAGSLFHRMQTFNGDYRCIVGVLSDVKQVRAEFSCFVFRNVIFEAGG